MIFLQKIKLFHPYILFLICFVLLNPLQAQVQNDGDLYIGDSSVLYAGSNGFNFGLGSNTITSRTKLDYGVLSFSNGASWNGADDLHFVDGYAQTQSNTAFILPIGQSGVYAPIQVTPSTSEAVDAAYFRSAPKTIGSTLDNSITSISSVEYWDIVSTGVNASISLSWRPSSAISDLTSSSLPNLTIVGWNGSKWVLIPSIVDDYSIQGEISSLVSGSISSNAAVDLSAYSAFSLGTTTKQLLVPKFNKVELLVYLNNDRLFIEASLPITALFIYDIMGKKIFSERINGNLKYDKPFHLADGVYITKIELNNGTSLFTKKLINKNKF
ncbi:T9SS type A sorting domain-containing protein [Flavobacterium franklandianum]|uniref:T9SS type A sorting domain-containing protein n=1 Tax=Flavobacterium franklandianum TaxID=2594430 RepID=A0A553C871_9FLAO|nr:T9SS type A sorting domain-containing protein [Flavobacterium franklandianum]TRX16711.1 T9SS type A sorting domain-containing protein [Flavobacterium franklandianum]